MMTAWRDYFVLGIQGLIFFYFITLNGLYLVLLLLSAAWCRRYKKKAALHPIDFDALESLKRLIPPVTLIVPAYNEERVIAQSVRSLLGIEYPRIQIAVINDGSTDNTLEELTRSFSLRKAEVRPSGELPTQPIRDFYVSVVEPRLVVVAKQNRSEEHTAELQPPCNLVCGLLLVNKRAGRGGCRPCGSGHTDRDRPLVG